MKKTGWYTIGIPVAILVLITVSSIFIYDQFFGKTVFTGKEKSIAVLPFVNLNSIPENEYLAYGITDEIIAQLNKIPDLKVVSHPAVLRFKGSDKNPQAIAADLHVAALLMGSVEKSGDHLKINARLVDANTGRQIWSTSYDKELKDIFSMQSEVSQLIAEQLNTELTAEEKNTVSRRPTQNLEAFNQYLKGRYYYSLRNKISLWKGVESFIKAIQLDSGFSKAYSGLADCYSALSYASFEPPTRVTLKAEAAARRAIQLDSTLAEPHTSLGYIRFYYYYDWAGAEQEFLKAIKLNPGYSQAYVSYGYYLTAMERFPEARSAMEKAVQLDPLSPSINTDMGFNLFYLQKYDQAIQSLQSALEINPKSPLAHVWLGRCYQEQKKYSEAIGEYQKSLITYKEWSVALAAIGYINGISGKYEEARIILNRMVTDSSSMYMTPYGMALVYASMQDRQNTFICLDEAYAQHSNWLVWLKLDPRWSVIHDDARYTRFLNKMELPKNNPLQNNKK